jgi:hypothetical protein
MGLALYVRSIRPVVIYFLAVLNLLQVFIAAKLVKKLAAFMSTKRSSPSS